MTTHQTPLAFIYDRSTTENTTELERRLTACGEYVTTQGWGFGGWWVDNGDYALTNDRRPAYDALLRTMRAAGTGPRVCLVHDWDRLSRDMQARGLMTRRVLLLDGWVETCAGEKRTPGGEDPHKGQLTQAPMLP